MQQQMFSEKRGWLLLMLVGIGVGQSVFFLALMKEAQASFSAGAVGPDYYLLALSIGAVLFLSSGRYVERYAAEYIAQGYISSLRKQVFDHTLSLPVTDRDLVNKGGTLLRLTSDMSAIRNWIVQGIAPLIVISIWLVIGTGVLFSIHPILAASVSVPLVLIITINIRMGRTLYSATEKARKSRGAMIRETSERLRRFFLIKLFNQYSKEKKVFSKRSDRLVVAQLAKAKATASLRAVNEGLLLLTVVLLMATGIQLATEGMLDLSYMPAMLAAALYMLTDLRRLSRLYELWTFYSLAGDKLDNFLSRPSAHCSRKKGIPDRSFEVELSDFSVPGRFKPVSGRIERGSRILLNGREGAGKSSLLQGIAGMLASHTGALRFNGRNCNRIKEGRWSQTVTLISQALPIFRGSVLENLMYGARQYNEEYFHKVVQVTALEDYLPSGLYVDLIVSEEGANLPSSVKFRIKIARALLRRPSLLLIDNDPALHEPEIQEMLLNIFSFYEGGVILGVYLPCFSESATDIWNLGKAPLRMQSDSNVIRFTSPSTAGR